MKKLFTLSALVIAATASQAQITLQQSDFTTWVPDNEKTYELTNYNATPSANATYDLSGATYGNIVTFNRSAYSGSIYPQANTFFTGTYGFSNYVYNVDIYEQLSTAGFYRLGEYMNRQAFSLTAVTTGPNDSLIFLQQTMNYSSPRKLLVFPMTMGTNWTSNYTFNANFQVTIASFGLNNTPGYRRTLVEKTDTVKGWGKMRVKDLNMAVSGYMDVLAVKTHVKTIDSFYLAGNPAPPTMLTAFGLAQGQINNRYIIAYYRKGEPSRPLLIENYSDAAYTTKTESFSHNEDLATVTSTSLVNFENEINMYPNPVVNGIMQIIFVDAAQNHQWSYELTNTLGQKVGANTLEATSGKAAIRFNTTAKGVHFVTIFKNGVKQITKQIVVE